MERKIPLWEKLFQLPGNIRGCDIREISQGLSRLSLNQLLLLNSLYKLTRDTDEGVSLKTLAAELKVTAATASEMVDALVRREIVERRHSENDRRAVAIRLQKEWYELFRRHERNYETRVESFFAGRPAERAEFERVIDEMNRYLAGLKNGGDAVDDGADK